MTEAEWLVCADPRPMLRFLLGSDSPRLQDVESFPDCRASDRKLRLFACACYHRIRHLLTDIRAQSAVEVAEQVADGILSEDERRRAEATVREPLDALEGRWRASRGAERITLLPTQAALALAGIILWDQAQKAAYYASSNASHTIAAFANPGRASGGDKAEERAQTDLLRCIFGPLPFRAVFLDPSWLAWGDGTVPRVARVIYEGRTFEQLPILADALEDAGCADPELLGQCRGQSPHVRGYWVVDLLLGKT